MCLYVKQEVKCAFFLLFCLLLCSTSLSLENRVKFNSSVSSTFQAGAKPFYISYNSGFAAGITGYDTIAVRNKHDKAPNAK